VEAPPISGIKCLCCSVLFTPASNNRGRQRFCSKDPCRKRAKSISNRRWRQKNPGYDSGPEQVARVRLWRANNPGYSQSKRRPKPPAPLQDSAPTQTSERQPLANLEANPPSVLFQRELEQEPGANSRSVDALQDSASTQQALVAGLISTIMGDALQDSFSQFTLKLVERGRRVLAGHPGGLAA
jgi:hypothetical protein